MKRIVIALLLFAPLIGYSKNFFVSPKGRDTGSGTKSAPFASFDRARQAVRSYKKAHPKENITVWFWGGVYTITEPIVFSPEDSANDGQVYTYCAVPNQKPIFRAGIPVTRWSRLTRFPKDLPIKSRNYVRVAHLKTFLKQKQAPSPSVASQMPQSKILTVYGNGKLLPRARGPHYMLEKIPQEIDNPTNAFCFPKGMIGKWSDLENAELVGVTSHSWVGNILPIASANLETRIAHTTVPSTYDFGPTSIFVKEKNVWIENSLALLDEPGEWVFDKKTSLLYLWPPKNVTSITVPLLSEIIRVEGIIKYNDVTDVPVKNITFKGLTFTQGNRFAWHGKTGWGLQHDWERFDSPSAMVRFRGAENCTVEECTFTTAGSSGLRFDLYAKKNKIIGNEFKDLGGVAILLAGYGPGKKDVNRNNVIKNNYIHNIGLYYPSSPAIFIWQSGRNEVANNELFDLPYTAICVTGRIVWNTQGGSEECSRTIRERELSGRHLNVAGPWDSREKYLHARSNKILRNNIHHVMQVCGDGNTIYVSGAGANNLVEENYCHHCPSKFMNSAIRCDDDQDKTTIRRNIIFQIGGDGEAIQNKGNNTIVENLFIDPKPNNNHHRGIIRFHRGKIKDSIIQKNLFYVTQKGLIPVCDGVQRHGEIQPRWCDTKADFNIYYNTEDPNWNKDRLVAFRKEGFEINSIIANPLFVDIAHANFQFQPDSPALKEKFGLKQPVLVEETGVLKPYAARFKAKKKQPKQSNEGVKKVKPVTKP